MRSAGFDIIATLLKSVIYEYSVYKLWIYFQIHNILFKVLFKVILTF